MRESICCGWEPGKAGTGVLARMIRQNPYRYICFGNKRKTKANVVEAKTLSKANRKEAI